MTLILYCTNTKIGPFLYQFIFVCDRMLWCETPLSISNSIMIPSNILKTSNMVVRLMEENPWNCIIQFFILSLEPTNFTKCTLFYALSAENDSNLHTITLVQNIFKYYIIILVPPSKSIIDSSIKLKSIRTLKYKS